MFAYHLQQVLTELCRHEDAAPDAYEDMERRFQSLRGSSRLPQGRENRARPLTDEQIASAILGLATKAPGWAGQAAAILTRRYPVGGAAVGFGKEPDLLGALKRILSDEDARRSLLTVQLSTAEGGVNSNGFATIAYDQDGQRCLTRYVPAEAASQLQPGAEQGYDFERRYATSSRELVLNRAFFDLLVRRVQQHRRRPPNLPDDSPEYDAEEAERARRIRLGATPSSSYLNIGVDNQVTWPREETLLHFAGHSLVLMPKTKDHVQSVHLDLHANGFSHVEAMTLINRLLSIMTWCDDQYAVMQDGWSGNPVPVAVPRRDLAFATAYQWIFDRKIPETEAGRRALALYREGRNAEQNYMIGYAVLSYFKVIEIQHPEGADVRKWLAANWPVIRDDLHDQHGIDTFLKAVGEEAPEDYLWKACRVAVAHVRKKHPSDPDIADELRRLDNVAGVMRRLARRLISEELGISECPFDGT